MIRSRSGRGDAVGRVCLATCAALLGAGILTATAIAAPRPVVRARAAGVAAVPIAGAPANRLLGGPTILYDNFGSPGTYYGGQGGNEAIDDLHLPAVGTLDTLLLQCYDPPGPGTYSATVTLYDNPSGLDLATGTVLGSYVVAGIARGDQIVAVPLSDAPAVPADLWVGVQFSSTTAGLVIHDVPSVGTSHDLYLENGDFYDFDGSPKANFALRLVDSPTHVLTVTIVGQGAVTRTPDLPAYVEGTPVQLSAAPDPHWDFVGWSVDASGTDNPLSLVMDGDKAITATFALESHTLTYLPGSNGTISGTTPQTVVHGSDGAPVTAVGNPGFHFVTWSDGVLTATRTDRNVVADLAVTATFARDNLACNGDFETDLSLWARYGSVELTRVQPGHESGWSMKIRSKSSSDCGIDDSPDCIQGALVGDKYRFTAWVLAGSSSSRNRKVKLRVYESGSSSYVSAEVTLGTTWKRLTLDYVVRRPGSSLSERFVYDPSNSGEYFFLDDVGIELLPPPPPPVTFTITATAGPGGSISPPNVSTVNQGASKTYTVTPSPGYAIQDVVVDPVTSVGAVSSYTFTNVQANRTIHATFVPIPPGQNLVTNPSFETGIQNWIRYGDASLSWNTTEGHTGSKSLKVTGRDASNGIDDSPNFAAPVAGVGVTYRFQAWVKAANSSSKGKVKIRVYELNDGSQVGSTVYSPESTLTNTRWKLLIAEHTVRQPNTALSMRVTTSSDDQTFLVDDVSIALVAPSATLAERSSVADATPALEFARPTVYPNPARGGATLALSLARPGALRAELYDVAGRLLHVLVDEAQAAAGTHRFAIERGRATKIGAGIYFYRAEVEGVQHRGRFVILE
jgi:hypothetical protein